MSITLRHSVTAVFSMLGIWFFGTACAQDSLVAPAPAAQDRPQTEDPLARWQPSEKQRAMLATLPKTVEEQRQELIRLARIPLPSYEERERFLALKGYGFPKSPRHPLRDNEQFLLDYYRSLGKPDKAELDALIASLKTRMIHLKGGKFIMGDFGPLVFKDKLTLSGESDNPAHEVILDGYSIMKGRVTYGEYELFLRDTGRPALLRESYVTSQRPGYVVGGVQWADADGYCRWLGQLTGKPFALTSEAQWEYAAREGGKLIAYPMYHWPGLKWQNKYQPDFDMVDEILPTIQAKAGKSNDILSPRPPSLNGENRIGMQDVVSSGSREWVADWYDENYYNVSAKRNPTGPATGSKKVARVGAYSIFHTLMGRESWEIDNPERTSSFRCALNDPKPWRK
ncbi:formylglycine-generating enzyme family protein [Uliginosibacterium sediminicola]|uniref:SUMF1/EgtB/PvdO family nonheme iron enzyme n=1 Tax=Uliginosibacterium sediminicola TaxID=2024550 RepID=A0ABU9Z1B4_9RHOO